MRTTLMQRIVAFFCSLHLLFFIASQAPFLDMSKLSSEVVARQMNFSFSGLNKLREWRNEKNSFFNTMANHYFALTQVGYPSYYFFLGAPKKYVIYSFEFTDNLGEALNEKPMFSTCPLVWDGCMAGDYYTDTLMLPLLEIMLMSEDSNQSTSPQYFLLQHARANLKKEYQNRYVAFVAYERPVYPWFKPAEERLKRRVIYVTN